VRRSAIVGIRDVGGRSARGLTARSARFHLDRQALRITYWIATGRRIILLTVFVKSRMREARELERAVRALARCLAQGHTIEEES
jgi:pilus assembly protein TadC